MKAIIVAAGYGSRLGDITKETPKELLDINGKSILEKQAELLKNNGVKKIIVVVGPNKSKFTNQEFQYIEDEFFNDHEQLGSLMVARKNFDEELLVLFSDVLFDQKTLSQILNLDCEFGIGLDKNWKKGYENRSEHPISQADLALIKDDKIIKIQKNLDYNENDSIAEFIGIMKLSLKGAKKFLWYFEKFEKVNKNQIHNSNSLNKGYLIDMIQELIKNDEIIIPIFIDGRWCEIDTPQDLENAKLMFG